MFDQLLFTWAPRGAAGPGFQPVAVTPRLADPRTTTSQTAIRYCRYTPPPGAEPVSYGWVVAGDDRIVFRRGGLDRSATRRPGNFYAHVLVGPVELAPVTELAARLGSDFWWRGEPVAEYLSRWGGDLVPVDLADVPRAEPAAVDEDDLAAVADAVLHPPVRVPVVLGRPPPVTAALVGELARRLPGAVEHLSVSTYEHPDDAAAFDVIGLSGADPAPLPSARRAFGALVTGRAVDAALLPPALAEPRSAAVLLGREAGRAALVRALLDGHAPVWAATRSLPGSLLAELATDLGRAAVEGPGAAWVAVLDRGRRMPALFPAALTRALVTTAATMPGRLDALGHAELVRAAVAPLGVAERPRFLVDALTGGGPLPEWDEAAAAVVGDVLVDRLARRRGNLPLDPAVPRLLRAVAGRRCGRWLQVLGPATDPAVAFRAVADLPARYRQAATQLVLIRCLYAAPGLADVRRISQLTAPTDEQAAQLLMNACLACRPGVPPSPVPYLLYLCHSVEFGRLPVRLGNPALRDAAERVAAGLDGTERRVVVKEVRKLGRRARTWWNSLRVPG